MESKVGKCKEDQHLELQSLRMNRVSRQTGYPVEISSLSTKPAFCVVKSTINRPTNYNYIENNNNDYYTYAFSLCKYFSSKEWIMN